MNARALLVALTTLVLPTVASAQKPRDPPFEFLLAPEVSVASRFGYAETAVGGLLGFGGRFSPALAARLELFAVSTGRSGGLWSTRHGMANFVVDWVHDRVRVGGGLGLTQLVFQRASEDSSVGSVAWTPSVEASFDVVHTSHFALAPTLRARVDLSPGHRSLVATPGAVLLVGLRFY